LKRGVFHWDAPHFCGSWPGLDFPGILPYIHLSQSVALQKDNLKVESAAF
jgi:hypothetical protein